MLPAGRSISRPWRRPSGGSQVTQLTLILAVTAALGWALPPS
jgi:hypothetical protein